MTNLEKKKDAFAAWNKNKLSDAQLSLLKSSLSDALETFEAMGERGIIENALRMKLLNVENVIDARKR